MVNIVEVLGLGRRGFGISREMRRRVSWTGEMTFRCDCRKGDQGIMVYKNWPTQDATYDFKAQRWSGSRVTSGPCGGVAGLTALGVAHPSLPILESLCRQPTFR